MLPRDNPGGEALEKGHAVKVSHSAAVVTTDEKGVILTASIQAAKLFGWSLSEMVGSNCTMLMELALRPLHDDFIQRYIRTKEARVIDQRERRVYGVNKSGKKIALLLSLTTLHMGNGITFVAVFQKPDNNCVKVQADLAGKIVQISKNCRGVFGYPSGELIGENVAVLCAEPHRSKHAQYVKRYNVFGNPRVLGVARNFFAQHRNGSHFPISLHVKKTQHGYSARIYVLDGLTEVVFNTENGSIVDASDSCHQMFGCTAEHLRGKQFSDLLDNMDPDTTGKPWHTKCLTADGGTLDVVVNGVQVQNSTVVRYHVSNAEKRRFLPGEKTSSDEESSSSDSSLEPGTREASLPHELEASLGLYHVDAVLGTGAFGSVRRAFHKISGYPVALKTLKRKQFEDFQMAFPPREVALIKALDPHPNVMQLHETIDSSLRIILVQEYLSGGELFDYCAKSGPLSEGECKKYFTQLMCGVEWLHRNGICHRDLKLENCMLNNEGTLKIIDLGLGTFYETAAGASLRTFCGSPDYAAPEVFMRKSYDGFAVDVWACGVILFALATTYVPFPTPQDVVDVKLFFPKEPKVTDDLKLIVRQILQFQPHKRPTAHALLCHSFVNHPENTPPRKELNMDIVAKTCEVLGCTAEQVTRSRYDSIRTTYNLLLEKHEKGPSTVLLPKYMPTTGMTLSSRNDSLADL